MTELQGWIVIVLLAAIAGSLYPLGRQIERFIRVMIHQRELLQQALKVDEYEALPFALRTFLDSVNDGHIPSLRRDDQGIRKGPRQALDEAVERRRNDHLND